MSSSEISKTLQFLTFKLREEVFAVDISRVREVLNLLTITKVPRMPAFMCGVMNVRGSVVPVVDLQQKFGMSKTEQGVDTCIIVMEISLDNETTTLGAMVDAVEEVWDLEVEQIEPPPRIGTHLNNEFIKGMGKRDNQFIIILDIDRIFSSADLISVKAEQL